MTPNERSCCFITAVCENKQLFINRFTISTEKVLICQCCVHNLLPPSGQKRKKWNGILDLKKLNQRNDVTYNNVLVHNFMHQRGVLRSKFDIARLSLR